MPGRTHKEAPFWVKMRRCETRILTEALRQSGGNVAETSRQLGINAARVRTRLKRLGIDVAKFRPVPGDADAPAETSASPSPPPDPCPEPPEPPEPPARDHWLYRAARQLPGDHE